MGRRLIPVQLLSLALLGSFLWSCDGSDSPTEARTGPVFAYTSHWAGEPESIVLWSVEDPEHGNLALEVQARDVTDFRGGQFRLRYPIDLVEYAGFEPGEFLDRTEELGHDSYPIGRFGPQDGAAQPSILIMQIVDRWSELPARSGSGTLVRIFFRVRGHPGAGDFEFLVDDPPWVGWLLCSNGNVFCRRPLSEMGFYGGTLEVSGL